MVWDPFFSSGRGFDPPKVVPGPRFYTKPPILDHFWPLDLTFFHSILMVFTVFHENLASDPPQEDLTPCFGRVLDPPFEVFFDPRFHKDSRVYVIFLDPPFWCVLTPLLDGFWPPFWTVFDPLKLTVFGHPFSQRFSSVCHLFWTPFLMCFWTPFLMSPRPPTLISHNRVPDPDAIPISLRGMVKKYGVETIFEGSSCFCAKIDKSGGCIFHSHLGFFVRSSGFLIGRVGIKFFHRTFFYVEIDL